MKPYPIELRRAQFMERCIPVTESGCWLWLGGEATKNGYGWFTVNGYKEYAHRAAHLLFVGPIPEGKLVCHRCDVKACVNPQHLYLGDHSTNGFDFHRSLGKFVARDRVAHLAHR